MDDESIRFVLASKSSSRRQILSDAHIPFDWLDADIDEQQIKSNGLKNGKTPEDIAVSLAMAKAVRIFDDHPEALVLGCDQILVCDERIYDKPRNLDDARAHIRRFRGTSHTLISAMTLLQKNAPQWTYVDIATLTMRDVSDDYIEDYIRTEGASILGSVGAYRLEGRGIQLFDDIIGNYFTILGLPLLPLLKELRQRRVLSS